VPARVLLLSLGLLSGAISAGLLFGLGDRRGGGDPSSLLVGAAALGGAGALVGMVVGALSSEHTADADRVRPTTVGVDYRFGRPAKLDERGAHALSFQFAPTYFFPGERARLRLFGHLGGLVRPKRDVDPRPQFDEPISGQEGTAPVVLTERELTAGVGLDFAMALPYPVLPARRSRFLGPAELRFRPEVQIRREVFDSAFEEPYVLQRTMLLPLTVGMRWHLSRRQRFTFYFGPRFDFVAYSDPGSKKLHRGGAEYGPLYGEAWYDIDFPMTLRPRSDGASRRASVNSMLSLGYVHSRFDGNGFNFGPVIGFLGPIIVDWHTRVRPVGWPVALQGTVGVTVGQGFGLSARVGVVLPDLGRRVP
jgi:hypothetical protein